MTVSVSRGASPARRGTKAEISVDKPTLNFTPDDWSTAQTVTVTAAADADTDDDRMVLVHRVRGGGYSPVAAELPVGVVDMDKCVLNVADAEARERDRRMEFVVSLARGEAVAFRMKLEVAARRSSGDGAKNHRAVLLGGAVSW